jgi:hypothetical protein
MGQSVFFCVIVALLATEGVALSAPDYLVKEVAAGSADLAPVTESDLIARLSSADVAMLGESHETGHERNILARIYKGLFAKTGSPRRCVVETYENLIGPDGSTSGAGLNDPVRAVYNSFCHPELIANNETWDYTALLAGALSGPGPGIVATHTGFRHMLPLARFYPNDFDPNSYVDASPHGSLTLQLPDSFDQAGEHARSFAPLALDNLLIRWIGRELLNGTSPGTLDGQLGSVFDSPALAFEGPESLKVYELKNVGASITHHQAFVGVFNPGMLTREILHALLSSPELTRYLAQAAGHVQIAYYRGGVGTLELGDLSLSTTGVVYFLTPDPAHAGGTKYLYVDSSLSVQTYDYVPSVSGARRNARMLPRGE